MIKNKTKLITLLVMLVFCSVKLKAQSIYFSCSDGTNDSYRLNDVKHMLLSGGTLMTLEFKDGSIYQRLISNIISFKYNETTGIDNTIYEFNSLDVKLFPNPNNGSFQLIYKLPTQSNLEVGIYTIDGKFIKTLFKGRQNAGEQHIGATLTELPNGIYTLRIDAEGFSVNKKITINKREK